MKKKLILIIVILVITLFKINVDAATCSTEEKKALKEESKMIEIIPILDIEEMPFYRVSINNFSKSFYIKDSNETTHYSLEGKYENPAYGYYSPGQTITFKVYGAIKTNCAYHYFTTIKVYFPYYNRYSTSPLCEGIEEFSLCRRNYSGNIESQEYFEEQIKKYKESLNKKEEVKEEKTISEKIIAFVIENIYIIVAIIILVVVIIVIIIRKVIRKKKKIKIDIDLK